MKRYKKSASLWLAAVLVCALLAGCGSDNGRTVTVIDGDFAEMKLFTQVARIMIESHTDIHVKVQDSMASSLAFQQIRDGKMDIYMSYDGSLLTAYLGKDPSEVPEGMTVYEYANQLGMETANVMLTPKLGGQNTYMVGVKRELADKLGLTCVSDLKPHAPELRFAAEHEFFDEGSKHYDAFAAFYALDFAQSSTLDRGLKYMAMDSGNMDVTVVYSTDGLNKKSDIVTLKDDLEFFPDYQGAYIVRKNLFQEYPELEEVFSMLEGHFNNDTCTELNYRIDVEGEDPYDVALDHLKQEKLLP